VRLALVMRGKACFCLEPLCALDAVMLAESGQILRSLGLLKQLQMSRVQEILLDLIDIANLRSVTSTMRSGREYVKSIPKMPPRLGECAFGSDTRHLEKSDVEEVTGCKKSDSGGFQMAGQVG